MKTRLLLVLLPALAIVGVPLDASANLDVGGVLSAKTIKADAAGTLHLSTRTVVLHNHKPQGDADLTSSGDAPEIAFVVSELTKFSGPAPLENPVKASLVWKDPATGARTFSSVIAFEDDAVDQAYTIVTTWYDALGNALGSDEEDVVVEGRGPAPVALDVLNPATAAGNVVLLEGDLVQVNFAVLCDFPWMAADCSAQQGESSHKDRIQLMTPDGAVIHKTKRGKSLSGLALLKAKTLSAQPLVVGYLRSDSGTVTDSSDTVITVVADPSTAALIARADALEAQVAALAAQLAEVSAGQGAQDAAIAANSAEHLRNWELILDLEADDVILEGRVTANEGSSAMNGAELASIRPLWQMLSSQIPAIETDVKANSGTGAKNAATIAANHQVLIKHMMLMSDDVITTRVKENTKGVATNAAALKDHKQLSEDTWVSFESRVTGNEGGIAKNAAGIAANTQKHADDGFFYESSITELDSYMTSSGAAIATNAAGIAANTQNHVDDGFFYESSIEELDEYISGSNAAIATNAAGIATNAAAIADGLGSPLANYEAILRNQAIRLVGGEAARMTFAHAELSLTGVPVGDYEDADGGYRYVADASIVDLTGDTDDSPLEVGISLTGNLPGIVFGAGAEVVFPDVTSAPPGTEADLFSIGSDGVKYLGRGTVLGSGKFYALLEGDLYLD